MYIIVTRTFPPELGGMQSLMWGLSREMSKNFMIKVFADYYENHKNFDEQVSFSIERVGGIKFLRKIRKAQLINEFIKDNKVVDANLSANFENNKKVIDAGANILVSGTTIFKENNGDIKKNIDLLKLK